MISRFLPGIFLTGRRSHVCVHQGCDLFPAALFHGVDLQELHTKNIACDYYNPKKYPGAVKADAKTIGEPYGKNYPGRTSR